MHTLVTNTAGGIKHSLWDSTGRLLEVVSGFLQTVYHGPFSFADFAAYLFAEINFSHEYDYMLSSVTSNESLSLGVDIISRPIHHSSFHITERGVLFPMSGVCIKDGWNGTFPNCFFTFLSLHILDFSKNSIYTFWDIINLKIQSSL